MHGFNAPGRYSRSARLLARLIARETAVDGVSFGFVSEVARKARASALAIAGWTVTHDGGPGKGECAILTKDSLRQVIFTTWVKITDGGGRGRLSRPIYAVVVITRAPSGRLTLFTMAHLPAHVEGLWRLIPLPNRIKLQWLLKRGGTNPGIITWIQAVQAWRLAVMDLAAGHDVDDIVVGADWNLSKYLSWVRDLVHRAWPGLTMAATKDPDLGRRNVGWLLTTMDEVDSSVHGTPASDHRVGRFTLKHWNKPRVVPTPKKPPNPFELCTYHGARMDQKTKAAVQKMEKLLGYLLTILQGCYGNDVAASAGTHGGGGVIDFAPADWQNKVRVARSIGWFIWHRLAIAGVWSEHIHGGIRNHGRLAPEAAAQQVDFDHYPTGKRDGLAGHNIDPDQFPKTPQAFDFVKTWRELQDAA